MQTEKCQFLTEKCQFETEKCQFETEKCQFAGALYMALGPYVGKSAAGTPPSGGGRRGRRGSLSDGSASIVTPSQVKGYHIPYILLYMIYPFTDRAPGESTPVTWHATPVR